MHLFFSIFFGGSHGHAPYEIAMESSTTLQWVTHNNRDLRRPHTLGAAKLDPARGG